MKKRKLKKGVKKIIYIILTIIILIVLYNIIKLIPYNNGAYDECINEGNGQEYCFRNYGQ